MRYQPSRLLYAFLFLALCLSACGGGGGAGSGGNSGGGGGGTPGMSISLNPSTFSVQRGMTGTSILTVTPQNGFSGTVSLFQSGLPQGINATYNSASATVFNLQFAVDTVTPTGPYPFTIIARANGVADASANGTLTVTSGSQPSFTLAASPSALSIPRGSAGTSGITITGSNGFSGSVTLSASNLPSGVTAAFSPNPATGTSTLTLTASASASTASSTISITGQASGGLTAGTTLGLTVTQPAGGAQVNMTPCLQDNDVIFFAFQDGAGPWTPVIGNGGTYSFNLASSRGAAAITLRDQRSPDQIYTMVLLGSASDLAQWMPGPCPGYQPVSGTYSGAGAGSTISVSVGVAGITNFPAAGGAGSWTTRTVMKKTLGDLFAAESIPGVGTLKCILRRDLALSVPNPSPGGDLNFSGAEAFVPPTFTVGTSGLSSTNFMLTSVSHIWNAGLDLGNVGSGFALASTALPPLPLVPASRLRQGDLQDISVTATPLDYQTNGTSPMLLSQVWIATPQNVSLAFNAPSTPPAVSLIQSQPHPRLRTFSSLSAPYDSSFILNAVQTQGSNSSRGWQVLLNPAWITNGGAFPIETPDFSGVAGWNPAWDLWPAVQILWNTTNSGFTWMASGGKVDGGRQWTCSYTAPINP